MGTSMMMGLHTGRLAALCGVNDGDMKPEHLMLKAITTIENLRAELAAVTAERDDWERTAIDELLKRNAVTAERDAARAKVEAVPDAYMPLYMALAKHSATLPEDVYRLANDVFLKFRHMADD